MDKNIFLLLSTAYFPPIQYFSWLLSGKSIVIEAQENYTKQTYRNRCKIYSPNGIQELTVPVERGSFHKVKVSDLRIDYSRNWQQNHLRSLKTAYNSSAFYEFYIDDIEKSIRRNHALLLDLNLDILQIIMSILDLDNRVILSSNYTDDPGKSGDYRYALHPKREEENFINRIPEYFQVFSPKSGFHTNLSILDLVFNMGPESFAYLLSCNKK